MRHRTYIYTLSALLLLLGGTGLFSQSSGSIPQFYNFSIRSGTYTDLDKPAVTVTDPNLMSNEFAGAGFNMPFKIEAFGRKMDFLKDTLFTLAGGFLVVNISSEQRFYVYDGFASRLIWRDATSSMSVQLEGQPGEQILKAQWKNLGLNGNSPDDFVNLQIWLFEKDNSFEVHVGPHHVTGTAGYYGNNGPAIGGFISDYTLTTADAAIHLTGSPASPGIDLTNVYFPLSGTPAAGTIYHFDYLATSSVRTDNAVAESVSFRPNPCTGLTRIQLPDGLEGVASTLVLHDALGREALRVEGVKNGSPIAGENLPGGVYYATFYQGGRAFNGGTLVIAK